MKDEVSSSKCGSEKMKTIRNCEYISLYTENVQGYVDHQGYRKIESEYQEIIRCLK